MKKLFNSPIFQVYSFILSFILINVYIIFKVNSDELFKSYIMIYLFWFILIVLLKVLSYYLEVEDKEDV